MNDKGELQHKPFHVYTMKQAIQEGFILDVLRNYTPIDSFYRLMKTVEDDPMFEPQQEIQMVADEQTPYVEKSE